MFLALAASSKKGRLFHDSRPFLASAWKPNDVTGAEIP
jgi:hypothetical protein